MYHFLSLDINILLLILTIGIIIDLIIYFIYKPTFLINIQSYAISLWILIISYISIPYILWVFTINFPSCWSRIPYPGYCFISMPDSIIWSILIVFIISKFIILKWYLIRNCVQKAKNLIWELSRLFLYWLLLFTAIPVLVYLLTFFLWLEHIQKVERAALSYLIIHFTIFILIIRKGISFFMKYKHIIK